MIPTPHISATDKSVVAPTVLMPGDPLRAKFIADNFLTDVQQFNGVRNMLGFTGQYKGKPVSVMGSGMGIPSIGIYSYELYKFYDVENIIRVGTAGAIHSDLKVKDIVFAAGASTNSNFFSQYKLVGSYSPIASFQLLRKAVEITEQHKFRYMVGNVLSSDYFYGDDFSLTMDWAKLGVLAVEMESAALYMNAARLGKNALGMFTISDSLVTGEATTAEERQNSFTDMMTVALETAVCL